MAFYITDHAMARYRERVDPAGDETALIQCLKTGKPSLLRALKKGKRNTLIIKTDQCYFICSGNKVVSVVKELTNDRGEIDLQ